MLGHLFILLGGWIVGKLREADDDHRIVESELHSRERYLTLLKLAISDILNPKKPEDRYYYLITHLANLFVADHGCFLMPDLNREQTVVAAATWPLETAGFRHAIQTR